MDWQSTVGNFPLVKYMQAKYLLPKYQWFFAVKAKYNLVDYQPAKYFVQSTTGFLDAGKVPTGLV